MAMSSTETMSNNSNDWLQFYTQNLNSSTRPIFLHDQVSAEATVVTTTTTTSSSVTRPGQFGSGHPSSSASNSLSPDQGRVSKAVRKRSRASRRTPTTLLNTDTTNFRAMVQQFTGGPSTVSFPTGSNFSFGLAPTRQQSFVVPPGGYHPLQQQQQQQQQQHVQQQLQQQQHQYQQQRQNQQYLLSLNNNNNSGGGAGGDGFLQRLSSSSRVGPTNMGLGGSSSGHIGHEFLREGVSSPVPSGAAGLNSNSAKENMSNSFIF